MTLSIKKIEYIFEKNQLLFFVLVFRVSLDHAVLQSLLPFMVCRPATTQTPTLAKSLSHPITSMRSYLFYLIHFWKLLVVVIVTVCVSMNVYAISGRLFLGVHSYDRETKFKEIEYTNV